MDTRRSAPMDLRRDGEPLCGPGTSKETRRFGELLRESGCSSSARVARCGASRWEASRVDGGRLGDLFEHEARDLGERALSDVSTRARAARTHIIGDALGRSAAATRLEAELCHLLAREHR